jgi:general stress protein 26
MNRNEIQENLEIARIVMEKAEFCFLITHSRQGDLHARLMQPFKPEADLSVWFGASLTSRKVHEIQNNPLVTLAYHYQPENAYVSLQGRALIEENASMFQQYWRSEWKEFWPEGPEGSDYTLIHVQPYQIDLMNIQKGVAPEPAGLRPLILTRELNEWSVLEDTTH